MSPDSFAAPAISETERKSVKQVVAAYVSAETSDCFAYRRYRTAGGSIARIIGVDFSNTAHQKLTELVSRLDLEPLTVNGEEILVCST
jgi:hypothetical protein